MVSITTLEGHCLHIVDCDPITLILKAASCLFEVVVVAAFDAAKITCNSNVLCPLVNDSRPILLHDIVSGHRFERRIMALPRSLDFVSRADSTM